MTDLYTNETLPGDYTDSRSPRTGELSGIQFNLLKRVVSYLRDNIFNGELRANPNGATSVSAAGNVRFRSNAGLTEVSENGGSFKQAIFSREGLISKGFFQIDAAQDYGIKADNSTDNGTALNVMWTAVTALLTAGTSVWVNLPAGIIKHSATQAVVCSGTASLVVTGAKGSVGYGGCGSVFKWTGAGGGKMFHLMGANRSLFEDFALDGANSADILFHGDSTLANGTTLAASAANTFRRIWLANTRLAQGGTVGCFLAGSATSPGTQFSEALFEDCFFTPERNTGAANTMTAFGWKSASGANCKNFTFRNCHWSFCDVAVDWTFGSGSMRISQIDMAEVRQAFQQGAGGQLTVHGGDIENSAVTAFRLHKCSFAGSEDIHGSIQGIECFVKMSDHLLNESYCAFKLEDCSIGDITGGNPAFALQGGPASFVSENNRYYGMGSTSRPYLAFNDSSGNPIYTQTRMSAAQFNVTSNGDRGGAPGSTFPLTPVFGIVPEYPHLKVFQTGVLTGSLTLDPSYEGQVRRVTMAQVLTYQDIINGQASSINSARYLFQTFENMRLVDAFARIDVPATGAGAAVYMQINKTSAQSEDYMRGQDVTQAAHTLLGAVDAQRGHIFQPGDAAYNSKGDQFLDASGFVFAQWITSGNLAALSAGQVTVYLTYEFFA